MKKDTNEDHAIDFLILDSDQLEHIRTDQPLELIEYARQHSWIIKGIQCAELNPSAKRRSFLTELITKAKEARVMYD